MVQGDHKIGFHSLEQSTDIFQLNWSPTYRSPVVLSARSGDLSGATVIVLSFSNHSAFTDSLSFG